jgi:hypothetical protein
MFSNGSATKERYGLAYSAFDTVAVNGPVLLNDFIEEISILYFYF